MKILTFETLANSKIFTQLKEDINSRTLVKNFEDLFKLFERYPIDFATIDLGYMNLRQFDKTYLSKVLKEYEIPYFTVALPHYVKENLANQITDLKYKYNEIKATFDILTDKNSLTAQELSFLMDYYSREIRELKSHINQKVRTNLVVDKIVNIIKGRDAKRWNLIHFGKKSSFKGINSKLKELKIESKILTLDI